MVNYKMHSCQTVLCNNMPENLNGKNLGLITKKKANKKIGPIFLELGPTYAGYDMSSLFVIIFAEWLDI